VGRWGRLGRLGRFDLPIGVAEKHRIELLFDGGLEKTAVGVAVLAGSLLLVRLLGAHAACPNI
jgi:hypothetical protein